MTSIKNLPENKVVGVGLTDEEEIKRDLFNIGSVLGVMDNERQTIWLPYNKVIRPISFDYRGRPTVFGYVETLGNDKQVDFTFTKDNCVLIRDNDWGHECLGNTLVKNTRLDKYDVVPARSVVSAWANGLAKTYIQNFNTHELSQIVGVITADMDSKMPDKVANALVNKRRFLVVPKEIRPGDKKEKYEQKVDYTKGIKTANGDFQVYNPHISTNLLQEGVFLFRTLINDFKQFIGMQSTGNKKIGANETDSQVYPIDQALLVARNAHIATKQKGFDRFNEIFGTNIQVIQNEEVREMLKEDIAIREGAFNESEVEGIPSANSPKTDKTTFTA